MNSNKSPFKFLDSYEQKDIDVFFGREKETEELYEALSGVKHLLVYGPSGSGKSSLIECGLRNQFSDADWFALTIRKGKNINASVFTSINNVLEAKIELNSKTKTPIDNDFGFSDAVEQLFEQQYQPIYLLFDQFEELLISGTKSEKNKFFASINKLIRRKIPGRIIIIMREEFIGHLSEFEHLCPSIFQYRFRVEKMERNNVKDVIDNILKAPRYLEKFTVSNREGLVNEILSKLPDQRKEIELSHVQVFLSELWDRAYSINNKIPELSPSLIRRNDNLETVLDSFLKKQLDDLKSEYGKRLPIEVLNTMITKRFTKLQLSESDIVNELEVKVNRHIGDLLQAFKSRDIIRNIIIGNESQYEISHDTLALVVGQNRTQEMIMREKAQKAYDEYVQEKGLLTRSQISKLENYRPYLQWSPKLKKLIVRSKRIWQTILIGLPSILIILLSLFFYLYISINDEQKKSDSAIKNFLNEKISKDVLLFENLNTRVKIILVPEGCPAKVIKEMDKLILDYQSDSLMINHLNKNNKNTLTNWQLKRSRLENELNEDCKKTLSSLNNKIDEKK